MTTALYLYRTGFEWLYVGSAAAMSWILFLTIGFLTVFNIRLFGRGAFLTRRVRRVTRHGQHQKQPAGRHWDWKGRRDFQRSE